MRVLVLLLVLGIGLISTAHAEELNELNHRLIPDKLVENTYGKLQIHPLSDGNFFPQQIDNLIVTSSDSSILEVLDVRHNNDFIVDVSLHAKNPGEVKLAFAASGYKSGELSLTVYDTKLNQRQLLVKTTPDNFSIDGPNKGYVSVGLADQDGFPVIALQNTLVTLSSSNEKVVQLQSDTIFIKKGEYFAIGSFEIHDEGEAKIYATANGLDVKSDVITVGQKDNRNVKLYAIPEKINTSQSSKGFLVAQLQDDNAEPIIAEDDITVHYSVTGSQYTEPVNSSDPLKDLRSDGTFVIPKGSYWGYAEYSVLHGVEDTYDVTLSTENPLSRESIEVESINLELIGDKLVEFEPLPVLSTGNKELIGVLHLNDEDDNPIVANDNLAIQMDSSDSDFLQFDEVVIHQGDSSALVFGQVAYDMQTDISVHPLTNTAEVIELDVFGTEKETFNLFSEPLIDKVLSGTDFPIAIYLDDGANMVNFPSNSQVFISPNDLVKVSPGRVTQDDEIVLLFARALKDGDTTVSFDIDGLESEADITSLTYNPISIHLGHPEKLLINAPNTFSIQMIDAEDKPVFAKSDTEFKLVFDDPNVQAPDSVLIEKGKYYTTFEAVPEESIEDVEVSVLASNFPLSKYELLTESVMPEISLSAPDTIFGDTSFDLWLSTNVNETPLEGLDVNWNVIGADVILREFVTNEDGQAKISVHARDPSKVTIDASVSGLWFAANAASKEIAIIQPVVEEDPQSELTIFDQLPEDFELLIIMGVLGAVVLLFVTQKKRMLKLSTKMPGNMSESIDSVKDRLSFEPLSDLKDKLQIRK